MSSVLTDGTLASTVNGLRFVNPFIIGSGPPSTNATVIGKAFAAGWGGVIAKTTSLTDTHVVNVQPRYGKLNTPGGETIGFQNIELISDRPFEDWEVDFRKVKDAWPDRILVGSIMERYDKARWQELARRCIEAGCDSLELNFSCPHGHPESGMGAAMGQNPAMVKEVTSWVVEAVGGRPVWAKMTPNITDIRIPARAARAGGASGVAAINTILSTVGINLKTLRPTPTVEGHSTYGGYSYRAVKPIALRMVGELATDQPGFTISGIGGVCSSVDAIEFILMGSSTVQSCTGPMLQGFEMVDELGEGLAAFLGQHGFTGIEAAIGKSLPYFSTHHHLVELQGARKAAKAAELANRDTEWGRKDFVAEAGQLVSSKE
ncbi:MAG: NAD-dependent dihydropyrimidine dehydrogenase subunit PreA [Myxococcales bacterium]|nr:NAD-dependent dihydropyrimidine dehydrogenase subunit PreA [Myxococcales bacterium]